MSAALPQAMIDEEGTAPRIPGTNPGSEPLAPSVMDGFAGDLYEAMAHAIQSSEKGNFAEAEKCFREILRTSPSPATAYHNLAVCLIEQGRSVEARRHLAEALRIHPNYAQAHRTLGSLLHDEGALAEALAHLRRAVDLKPTDVQALNNLGVVLSKSGRPAEAAIILRQAVRTQPLMVEAYNNLGIALTASGRLSAARYWLKKALALRPQYGAGHANLGNTYKEEGRLPEALACYDLAMAVSADAVSTRWNRSLALLQMGDFERGWEEYELRWQRPQAFRHHFKQPMWAGESLVGKTILLHAEQGLGDTIQFVRYGALLQARGAKVVFACPQPLMRLFAHCPIIDQIVPEDKALPPFDAHAPLMSLPRILKTTLSTIPAAVSYLHPSSEDLAYWADQVNKSVATGDFKVGIVWQGNPHHPWDAFRSVRLNEFEKLWPVRQVRFFSLQAGPGADQLEDAVKFQGTTPVAKLRKADVAATLDLADLAAIMRHLDLVITVDTATAHLAGALGIDVWILLGAISDWRWLQTRRDSPWYPTARLFRQKKLGTWGPVFRQIHNELTAVVQSIRQRAG